MSVADPQVLTRLVAFDRKVAEVRQSLEAGRRKVAQLQELETEYAADYAAAEEKSKDLRLDIRKAELEVAELRRQVKVHSGHLNEIQEQREWRALNDEIRYIQRQIEDKEEATLVVMEDAEKAKTAAADAKKLLTDKQAEIAHQKQEVENERSKLESLLEQARRDREAFVAQMPPATLTFYERRAKRMELPVVWMREGACSYCHHRLTPQGLIEVRQAKRLVMCESCGRIIVAALEAETPPEAN